MAIPETGLFILTPASINAIVPEQTVAIEDDPFDSKTSLTTLTVYGHSSGIIPLSPLWAKLPCPTSRLDVPLRGRASPVQNGGKL